MSTQNTLPLVLLILWTALAAQAQDYTYDANGNLQADHNKQIESIHYNHLNLVDTITYQDGRKIIYLYAASGKKIRQQVLLADGTIKQKRDYSDIFLYERDTLREIQHTDGRCVPGVAGQANSSWEYQYHLRDQLGNVRSTLTSAPRTSNAVATFEASTGPGKFLRYGNARRVNTLLFDHTQKVHSPRSTVHSRNAQIQETHYAQRLNGSAHERYGIARSMSVMAGDTIKLEVYAKYIDPNIDNRHAALTTLLTQIATAGASTGAVIDGPGYASQAATPFPFAGLNNTAASTGNGPKAYLNWLVFNRDFTLRTGGFVQLTTVAKENGSGVPHEKLASTLLIDAPGYVYTYLSNEEATPLEVYFDDFSVTQVMGPVIQETDYDPFGLTFNEYSRENTQPNNYLYNGKELQKDLDLNWSDYGARMYDAALGRWHVIDPMAEKYNSFSPYSYVLNNPIKHIDPDGRNSQIITSTCEDCPSIKRPGMSPQELIDHSKTATVYKGAVDTDAKIMVFVVYVNTDSPATVTTKQKKTNPDHSNKTQTVVYVNGKEVGVVPKKGGKDVDHTTVIVRVNHSAEKKEAYNAALKTHIELRKTFEITNGINRMEAPYQESHFSVNNGVVESSSHPKEGQADKAARQEFRQQLQEELDNEQKRTP